MYSLKSLKFTKKRSFQIGILVCLFLTIGSLIFIIQKKQSSPKVVLIPPVVGIALSTPSVFPLAIQSANLIAQEATPTLDSEEWIFLKFINDYRATFGVRSLKVSATLTKAAKWMTQDMSVHGLSHKDSLGRMPTARAAFFGYSGGVAENALFGASTGQRAFEQFRDACDGDANGNNCTYAHRENMKMPQYASIGISRYSGGGTYWWTTDFGGVVDQEITPPAGGSTPTPTDISTSITPSITTTPIPGDGTILKIALHIGGIGSNATLGENATPKHSKLSADIVLTDATNHEAAKSTNDAIFNSSTSTYDVAVPLSVASGAYIAKVRLSNTLWKTIPGVIDIVAKGTTTASVTLVSGDVNGDNLLNLSDYTIVADCVGKKASCTPTNNAKSDLNDDGTTDVFDLNILLSGLDKRNGD